MKLDKMTFARVIAHCVSNGMSSGEYEVEQLDFLINVNVLVQAPATANPAEVDNLMALMAEGTRKIEAIKAYRTLTGSFLKESKDAVEKYWISKGYYQPKTEEGASLGDILNHATGRNKAGNDISGI